MSNHDQARTACRASICLFLTILILPAGLAAQTAWDYADSEPANNPLTWMCSGGDPGAQMIKHEHRNWHCTNPDAANPQWGRAFIAFHQQFILDYEIWRLSLGGDRVEIWDFPPGAIIPGDDETTSTPYTHCPEAPGSIRPAGAVCNSCASLPASLNVMNIGSFPTLGDAGAVIESSGWHDNFHIAAGAAGGSCNELGSAATAPRDPVFFMGHKKVDDIARTWLRQQPCDIVIVLDRSGSMNDDCDNNVNCSGPNPPGDTDCRLNAAKNAALLLADLLDDSGVDGTQHKVGLVSFAGTASAEVGLTNASGVVTDNGMNDTAYEMAIAGIEACGATSIGDGIDEAVTMLAGGTNDHQAILLLSDGLHNTDPSIESAAAGLGNIQLCAVGIGPGGNEITLRDVAESSGGIWVAQDDLDSTSLTLEKFFVMCFAQIFDEVISSDPHYSFPPNYATYPTVVELEVMDIDRKLMIASGFRPPAGQEPNPACRIGMIVTTPNGDLVLPDGPGVEVGTGNQWAFTRVRLPYGGAHGGTWQARFIRPQRIFFHGFPTDAYAAPEEGIRLVRDEIHRVLPAGGQNVLYYEDGNLTGFSAYAQALAKEQETGVIQNVVVADSPAEFHDLLLQSWDLIVFARQLDPTPQVYDDRLSGVLCRIRKALVTDLLPQSQLYGCVGMGVEPVPFERLTGDGQLLEGPVELVTRPYPGDYLALFGGASNEPLIAQGWSEQGLPIIVGTGSNCGEQPAFYTTHTAGVGRVEPFAVRPRVLVGQSILATFEMRELNRPYGGWDAVAAQVELTRPGRAKQQTSDSSPVLETYQLYDDGTHGDKAIGNNTWTNLIPAVATEAGPHKLRGIFDLTLNGQTVRREAEYAVIVEPLPEQCFRMNCNDLHLVTPGWQIALGPCVGNMCLEEDSYTIVYQADQDWLCVEQDGVLVPVGDTYQWSTPPVTAGKPTCFGDVNPVHLCIPADQQTGDEVVVQMTMYAQGGSGEPQICRTVYRVAPPGVSPTPETPAVAGFHLGEASPNPFNPRTEISFSVPGTGGERVATRLAVFDLKGRRVRTLLDEDRAAGTYTAVWNGRDDAGQQVSGGVYLYRLEAGGQTATGKMALIK